MKNLTWQNPEQLFVAQELINKVKSKCCGIKGIDNFQKKYIFSYDNLYESLQDVIRKNIDLSIIRAKKDLSGMTGLDSYL